MKIIKTIVTLGILSQITTAQSSTIQQLQSLEQVKNSFELFRFYDLDMDSEISYFELTRGFKLDFSKDIAYSDNITMKEEANKACQQMMVLYDFDSSKTLQWKQFQFFMGQQNDDIPNIDFQIDCSLKKQLRKQIQENMLINQQKRRNKVNYTFVDLLQKESNNTCKIGFTMLSNPFQKLDQQLVILRHI